MRRPVSLALSVSLCVAFSTEASPQSPTNGPHLVCDSPSYDFGSVSNVEAVSNTFLLRNTGTATAEVQKVWAGCSCTGQRLGATAIPPGGSTTLDVTIDLKNRNGRQKKSIYVHSNGPSSPLQLQMTGEATWSRREAPAIPSMPVCVDVGDRPGEVDVHPARLDVGTVFDDRPLSASIEIRRTGFGKMAVTNVQCAIPGAKVSVAETQTGEAFRVSLAMAPPLPIGAITGEVVALTDNPTHPRIAVPVKGQVLGDIVTTPSEVVLTAAGGQEAKPVVRYVGVRSRSGRLFRMLGVTASSPTVHVEWTLLPDGRGYLVILSNLVARALPPEGRIVLRTDAPRQSEMAVPLRVIGGQSAGIASAASSAKNTPTVAIEYYHEPGCPDCTRVEQEVLPALQAQYEGFYVIQDFDLNVTSNILALLELQKCHGVSTTNDTPVWMLVGTNFLLGGVAEISELLLPAVGACLSEPAARDMSPQRTHGGP